VLEQLISHCRPVTRKTNTEKYKKQSIKEVKHEESIDSDSKGIAAWLIPSTKRPIEPSQ
jgi:hypothetical protein